jgi:hypothetical protein
MYYPAISYRVIEENHGNLSYDGRPPSRYSIPQYLEYEAG